jgi:hypothetical protein
MAMSTTSPHLHRPFFAQVSARRVGTWSLLMVPGTGIATVAAWIAGTFLQTAVFGLDDQQLLSDAGAWGYVAWFLLLALTILPAAAGIVLGVRARDLGERRSGTAGIVANGVIGAYLVVTAAGNLLLG